jgi:excisionase family DNA binding protein
MLTTQNATKPISRSVKTLAADLGISPGLVRLEIARGHLEVVRIGRRVIICEDAIERWLDRGIQRRPVLGASESHDER